MSDCFNLVTEVSDMCYEMSEEFGEIFNDIFHAAADGETMTIVECDQFDWEDLKVLADKIRKMGFHVEILIHGGERLVIDWALEEN